MKLLKPISCRREIGRGNVKAPDTLVESLVEGFSDGSSILPASTKNEISPRGLFSFLVDKTRENRSPVNKSPQCGDFLGRG